jgi:DNA-binding CsgD family transcriptional regulator
VTTVHVSLGTLQRAIQLVNSLAEIDDPADFGARALPGVGELVGCDHLSYAEIGASPGLSFSCGHPAGIVTSSQLAVFAAHLHEHPLVNHYRGTDDGSPVKISDFLSRDRFHRLGLYREFFRSLSVEHQLAVRLSSPDDQIIGIALNRGHRDFTESERGLLGVLRVTLTAARTRAAQRHRARRALAADDSRLQGLTDRELRVLELVALGSTNGSIARAMDISPRTVAKHLEHVYRKLGVASRAAAAHQLRRDG